MTQEPKLGNEKVVEYLRNVLKRTISVDAGVASEILPEVHASNLTPMRLAASETVTMLKSAAEGYRERTMHDTQNLEQMLQGKPWWVKAVAYNKPPFASFPAHQISGSVSNKRQKHALLEHWSNVMQYHGPIWTSGNDVVLFDAPSECMGSICRKLDSARERIWIETYSFDNSAIAGVFVEKLCAASKRGVDVILQMDAFGSFFSSNIWANSLKDSGVKLVYFNPWWRRIGPFVWRNHRKLAIVDDTAFCGSLNIDRRAFNLRETTKKFEPLRIALPRSLEKFKEVTKWMKSVVSRRSTEQPDDFNHVVKLRGTIVEKIANDFCNILNLSKLPLRRFPPQHLTSKRIKFDEGDRKGSGNTIKDVSIGLLTANGQKPHSSTYVSVLKSLITNARKSLVIASSYFHPPFALRTAIARTARNGVPTTLFLSGRSDVPFDAKATAAILPYFLIGSHNFARAFFLMTRHLHAKTVTVDGLFTILGSFNFDRYSARRNLEVGVVILDSRVADAVNRSVSQKCDSNQSIEYTLAGSSHSNLWRRIGSVLSYELVRFTGTQFWDGFKPLN